MGLIDCEGKWDLLAVREMGLIGCHGKWDLLADKAKGAYSLPV